MHKLLTVSELQEGDEILLHKDLDTWAIVENVQQDGKFTTVTLTDGRQTQHLSEQRVTVF